MSSHQFVTAKRCSEEFWKNVEGIDVEILMTYFGMEVCHHITGILQRHWLEPF